MNILITGTSSGFGRKAVETLASKGHTVVASMRGVGGKNAEAAKSIESWAKDNNAKVFVVELDVADDASVDKGVAQAIEKAGGLDVVVNNAGIANMGVQEAFSIAQAKQIFDVNTFGPMRVSNAVLPHLRGKKAGLIVNISSIVSQFPFPFMGIYCASKAALEVLSDDYNVTLQGSGVESVLLEPGGYPTEIYGKLMQPDNAEKVMPGYPNAGPTMEGMSKGFQTLFETAKPDPQDVVDGLVKLIETPAGQRPGCTVVDGVSGKIVESHLEAKGKVYGEFLKIYS